MIFVVDSQDDRRYDYAAKYMSDILKILEFLNEFPYILILLNKADVDLTDDPDFQIKMEYLVDKLNNIFVSREKSWKYDIISTSIYNYYAKEPSRRKNG